MEKNNSNCKVIIPANSDFSVVARMMIAGCCAIYNVDFAIIDDIEVASDEAICCLINQPRKICNIQISIDKKDEGLVLEFVSGSSSLDQQRRKSDVEITRCILETLVPKVNICSDDRGVYCITFYFPQI